MIRKQFFIDRDTSQRLKQLATETGVSEAELIRDAINQKLASTVQEADAWRDGLARVAGAWADRDDMQALVNDLRVGNRRRLTRLGLVEKD